MGLLKWAEEKARTFKWYHYSLLKGAVVAIAFLAAKLFPVLLKAHWIWYVLAYIAFVIPLWIKMFSKNKVI